MSCRQEVSRTTPKCTCCDHCIQHQKKNSARGSPSRNCREPPCYRSRANESYYKNYAIPDEYYQRTHHSRSRLRDGNDSGQDQWVDKNTLKTLGSLRQRACKFIENSEAAPSGEESRSARNRESHEDGCASRRIRNLDYSPQSTFLKKMKKQAEEVNSSQKTGPSTQCGCSKCAITGDRFLIQIPCSCCKCSGNDRPKQSLNKSRLRERETHYSDISSMHDLCTCFRTWRQKSCDRNKDDYRGECEEPCDPDEAYLDECSNSDSSCDESRVKPISRKKTVKSEHVSRCDRKRSYRRKDGADHRPCQLPDDFESSLKRPYPDSCERCWRYASPSRSPVNKPSQRYDPNYRRSNSLVNIPCGSRGRGISTGSRESKSGHSSETKVHELMFPMNQSLTTARSADNVSRVRKTRKTSSQKKNIKECQRERRGGSEKIPPQSRSGGRCVSISPAEKGRPDPMQRSPSMLNKIFRKSIVHASTPESASFSAKNRLRPGSSSLVQPEESIQQMGKARIKSSSGCHCDRDVNGNIIPHPEIKHCACTKGACPPEKKDKGVSERERSDAGNQKQKENLPKICLCRVTRRRRRPVIEDKLRQSSHSYQFNKPDTPAREPSNIRQSNPLTLMEDEASRGGCTCGRGPNNMQNNPRKYCVFYMNNIKADADKDVEVLIEELTEGRGGKGGKDEVVKNRMKKLRKQRGDSMALRFQKGVAEKCGRPGSSGVFYY